MSLVETFCSADDFCQFFEPHWERIQLKNGLIQRRRNSRLSFIEVVNDQLNPFLRSSILGIAGLSTFSSTWLLLLLTSTQEAFAKSTFQIVHQEIVSDYDLAGWSYTKIDGATIIAPLGRIPRLS